MSEQASLLGLPDEILRIIIAKCTTISVAKLSQCCTRLQYIIKRYKLQHVSANFLGVVYAGHDGPVQAHLEFPEGNICKPFQVPSLHLPVSVSLYDIMAKMLVEIMSTTSISLTGVDLPEVTDEILPILEKTSPAVFHINLCTTSITLEELRPTIININLLFRFEKYYSNGLSELLFEHVKTVLNSTKPIDWNLGFVRIEDDEEMKSFVYDLWNGYYFKVTCDGDNITVSSDTDGVHKSVIYIQLQRKNYFEQQLGLHQDLEN